MRDWLLGCTVLYGLFALSVLLAPSASLPIDVVSTVSTFLSQAGSPPLVSAPERVEFVLNAALVSPIAIAGMSRSGATTWRDWTAWAFVGSASIEAAQGLLLSGRSASVMDVAANTSGALLGALCVSSIRVLRRIHAADEAQSAP